MVSFSVVRLLNLMSFVKTRHIFSTFIFFLAVSGQNSLANDCAGVLIGKYNPSAPTTNLPDLGSQEQPREGRGRALVRVTTDLFRWARGDVQAALRINLGNVAPGPISAKIKNIVALVGYAYSLAPKASLAMRTYEGDPLENLQRGLEPVVFEAAFPIEPPVLLVIKEVQSQINSLIGSLKHSSGVTREHLRYLFEVTNGWEVTNLTRFAPRLKTGEGESSFLPNKLINLDGVIFAIQNSGPVLELYRIQLSGAVKVEVLDSLNIADLSTLKTQFDYTNGGRDPAEDYSLLLGYGASEARSYLRIRDDVAYLLPEVEINGLRFLIDGEVSPPKLMMAFMDPKPGDPELDTRSIDVSGPGEAEYRVFSQMLERPPLGSGIIPKRTLHVASIDDGEIRYLGMTKPATIDDIFSIFKFRNDIYAVVRPHDSRPQYALAKLREGAFEIQENIHLPDKLLDLPAGFEVRSASIVDSEGTLEMTLVLSEVLLSVVVIRAQFDGVEFKLLD